MAYSLLRGEGLNPVVEVKAAQESQIYVEPYLSAIYQIPTGYAPGRVVSAYSNYLSDSDSYLISSDAVRSYIRQVFGSQAETALRVAYCESGFKTDVISRTNDVGVFQINLAAHGSVIPGGTRAEKILWLQNYHNNIDFAWGLYQRSGFVPWVCYTKGIY